MQGNLIARTADLFAQGRQKVMSSICGLEAAAGARSQVVPPLPSISLGRRRLRGDRRPHPRRARRRRRFRRGCGRARAERVPARAANGRDPGQVWAPCRKRPSGSHLMSCTRRVASTAAPRDADRYRPQRLRFSPDRQAMLGTRHRRSRLHRRRIDVVVSPLLVAELERVLARPRFRRYIDHQTQPTSSCASNATPRWPATRRTSGR